MHWDGFCRLLQGFTILVMSAAPLIADETSARQMRQGNVFGVNLGWEPGWDTVGTVRLLGIARNLVGEWGYIRHGFDPKENVEDCRRSMAMIRAHRLIPVTGGAYPDNQFLEEGKHYPRLDPDGSMRTAARHKAQVWRKMYEAGIPFYVVEVMNEVNIGDAWPAEKYAQWLYDFAVEAKEAYPGLKVCSCGMAGSGADYYDKMLKFKPELKNVVDFWGLHPYGANHPPEYRPQGCSLRCYEETEAALKKHGVNPIRLMCTETGYELEFSDTGKDNKYPPIKEDNRAEYMARAFRDYYVPRQTIECVAVFQMWDFPWHNWNGWDLMYHDGTPRPMYQSLAAEPKTGGKDWLPTGPGKITGRLTWGETGIGAPRVVVHTDLGLYAAVTDDNGNFEITDLPLGQYAVHAFSDEWKPVEHGMVTVTSDTPGVFNRKLERASLIPPVLGPAGAAIDSDVPPGWARCEEQAGSVDMKIDSTVHYNGRNTHRITLHPIIDGTLVEQSGGVLVYADYSSAYPNEVFIADVFVRSTDGVWAEGKGPWLELVLSNGRGEPTTTARAFSPDFKADGKWHSITAALHGPARSTRIRIACGVTAFGGTFHFSEPFVAGADFPLPADADYRTTGYTPPLYELNKRFFAQAPVGVATRKPDLKTANISGRVLDFRGRPLPAATVATDAPVFVALTDADGRYNLTVPSGKRMRVRAFALGETPAISAPLILIEGETRTENMQTDPPPAPPQLVNGGFNTYHPQEFGLMTGWIGFGTTDGTAESGHKGIVVYGKAFSYEGKGLYFAQSGSNTKNGGAYQIVQAEPGITYQLTGQVFTYTHGEAKKPMDNNCRIGIDPTGGRDPDSPDVVWSKTIESEEKWTAVSTRAAAKTCRLTVFVRHEMRRANYWNLTMFDDLKLEKTD